MAKKNFNPKDEELLKEIRDNREFAEREWKPIREQAKKDMKYLSGDPWDETEKKQRQDNKRPCLALDELNQYVNQLVNQARQNKRGIVVAPEGFGANEETARLRQGRIRQIEYESRAANAYIVGLENAASRSYGFWRVVTEFMPGTFNQRVRVIPVPNPDTILIDPEFQQRDGSDMRWAFIFKPVARSEFAEQWPDAEIKDFDGDLVSEFPQWLQDQRVVVAEYWKVKHVRHKLLQLADGSVIYEDPKVRPMLPVVNTRISIEPQVCQYITNGVEILDYTEWPSKYIPVVPVVGKEMYVDRGGGTKRELLSLIRLARDPYMLYCYYRTTEAEMVGMTPKTPWIGYQGQFETNTDWENINTVPMGFAEVLPMVDQASGQVLPLPQRVTFEPPIQAMEIGAEAARRAIQAAMGISALPTAAQRNSEKSGVALERIAAQESHGSSHFIDNWEMSISHTGRIINELIPAIEDTPREVLLRGDDEKYERKMLDAPADYGDGEHDITVSAGPSYQSERENASAFVDKLIESPEIFARIGHLAIKLKNLGPIGNEIAELLTPPELLAEQGQEPLPPRAAAVVQQMKMQLQQAEMAMQETAAKLEELEVEKKGRLIEAETKKEIAMIEAETQKFLKSLDVMMNDKKLESNEDIAELRVAVQKYIAELNARLEKYKADTKPEPKPATSAQ